MQFFGAFAAKTPPDNEAAAAVVEELLQHLAGHLSVLDKTVRYRSAQLLHQLLSKVPDSLLLEDSVVEELRSSLMERLHDKLPAVRAEACKAISHLVTEDEVRARPAVQPKLACCGQCSGARWSGSCHATCLHMQFLTTQRAWLGEAGVVLACGVGTHSLFRVLHTVFTASCRQKSTLLHCCLLVQEGQSVMAEMMVLLATDKSKDVRIAVVQSLPLDAATLPVLLERTRDINPLVRKALVQRLEGLSVRLLRYSALPRPGLVSPAMWPLTATLAWAAAAATGPADCAWKYWQQYPVEKLPDA